MKMDTSLTELFLLLGMNCYGKYSILRMKINILRNFIKRIVETMIEGCSSRRKSNILYFQES